MTTAFLLWALSWIPPVYAGSFAARRLTEAPHLRAVIIVLGAILYAYATCLAAIAIQFTPALVFGISTMGLVVCLITDIRQNRLPYPSFRRPALTPGISILAVTWLLITLLLAWLLWLGMRLPPHFADGAETHCAGPVTWYADRAFSWPVAGVDRSAMDTINGYLKLPHLLFYYNAAAAGDSGFLSLGQFQGLLLLLTCGWAICRELNLGHGAAMIACMASLAVTETQVQVVECYLDVLVAATLAAVLLSCLLVAKAPTEKRLLGLACTAGTAMAIKVTGPFQAGPLWFLFTAYGLWILRRKSVPLAIGTAAKCGMILLLLGGFWYIASWVRFSNPLHPFQISLAGRVIFKGITAYGGESWLLEPKGLNRLTALPMTWAERWPDYSLGSPFAGLGPLFILAGLPAFLIQGGAALIRRNVPALTFTLSAVLIVALHPSAWQPRYSLIVATIGGIGIAQLFHQSGRIFRTLLGAGTTLGLVLATFHAIPYQVTGFYQPRAFWSASIGSPMRAHLGSRQLVPDANSIHQRLLIDAEFKGKRILISPRNYVGSFVRPQMDSRILQTDRMDQLRSFVETYKPDYIYIPTSAPPKPAEVNILEAVRELGPLVEETPAPPMDQRLASYYMAPGSIEHLFKVNLSAQQSVNK